MVNLQKKKNKEKEIYFTLWRKKKQQRILIQKAIIVT